MQDNRIDFVDEPKALKKLIAYLKKNKRPIAIDFECEYNLHRYGMHLCLIQLFDGERCYLIDTVKIRDIKILKKIFSGKLMKVMYAAHGDICLIKHLYKLPMKNVWDAQIAARLAGFEKLSLARVIEELLDIRTSKSKRKQKANWNRRPLTQELIEYAADDVFYLFQLKEKLESRINDPELIEKLKEENKKLEAAVFKPKRNPHLKIKNARYLNYVEKQYLKAFFEVRDTISKELDMSPHYLLNNDTLIQISKNVPQERADWMALRGLHRKGKSFVDHFIKTKLKVDSSKKPKPKSKSKPWPRKRRPKE